MKWMSYIGIVLFIALLTSSCSPQKRLSRFADKHPELIARLTDTLVFNDTVIYEKVVTVYDTVVTDPILIDTTWSAKPIDTLTLYDPKSKATVTIFKQYDKLSVSVSVPPQIIPIEIPVIIRDTIPIEVKIPVNEYVEIPPCPKKWWKFWLGIGVMLVIAIAIKKLAR